MIVIDPSYNWAEWQVIQSKINPKTYRLTLFISNLWRTSLSPNSILPPTSMIACNISKTDPSKNQTTPLSTSIIAVPIFKVHLIHNPEITQQVQLRKKNSHGDVDSKPNNEASITSFKNRSDTEANSQNFRSFSNNSNYQLPKANNLTISPTKRMPPFKLPRIDQ